MDMSRTRITPRQLVHHYLGAVHVSAKAVAKALACAFRRGYVPNYSPPPHAFDQPMVLLSVTSRFAALYRALGDDGSAAAVPRGLVESRFHMGIDNLSTGLLLARLGLALMSVERHCLTMAGTTTTLAHEINLSRYTTEVSAIPIWLAVEHITGLIVPPARIDEDLRKRVAVGYSAFHVTVDGLFNDGLTVKLNSRWHFEPISRTPVTPDDATPPF